jgi:molybdopterin adenylyltransferase
METIGTFVLRALVVVNYVVRRRAPQGEIKIIAYAVLTSSDTGSAGKRVDTSGDAIVEIMDGAGFDLAERVMLPDDFDQLSEQIISWCDSGNIDVVLTTGGTGLSSRDVMPEVTRKLIDLEIPGMAEAMRAESLKVTNMAMISRAVTGVRGSTLVINLPGSTGGVRDNLGVVLPVIEHAAEVLQDRQTGEHPI